MKILIRHAEPEDFKQIQKIYTLPKAISGTLQVPFPSEELWKKRLSDTPKDAYILVGEIDKQVLGSLGLFVTNNSPRRRHAGHIGMAVHDDWHGKGIGSALLKSAVELADNWLNLLRLELTVFTDNQRAIDLYEKNGFVKEGMLKGYAFTNGEFKDVFSMARLKTSN